MSSSGLISLDGMGAPLMILGHVMMIKYMRIDIRHA